MGGSIRARFLGKPEGPAGKVGRVTLEGATQMDWNKDLLFSPKRLIRDTPKTSTQIEEKRRIRGRKRGG